MRIANVVPTNMTHLLPPSQSYHLILAEFCDPESPYVTYYRGEALREGSWVILDNGAYEYGETPDIDRLIRAAKVTNPQEIVLPDVMFGEKCDDKTCRAAYDGWNRLTQAGVISHAFMGVPHGNTIDDWMECARFLMDILPISSLGVAEKDAIKLWGGDRSQAVRAISDFPVDIHLLGMMEDMRDIRDMVTRQRIRGVDGSKLIVWGMEEIAVHPEIDELPPYPGRPSNYFATEYVGVRASRVIRENIDRWEMLCD